MPSTDSERQDEVSPIAELPRITMLEARDRMTEVVEKVISGEPQVVTRYSRDSIVLVAVKRYEQLCALEASAA